MMVDAQSVCNEQYHILPGPQTLHGLIRWDRDADQRTAALDFLDGDEVLRSYSFADLRKCVLSLAAVLRQTLDAAGSAERHPVVPLLLPQSPALYITILAILEVGAAFCPINLDSPSERVKFVVNDVSASILVTTPQYQSMVNWSDGPKLVLVDELPRIPVNPLADTPQSPEPQPHDLAYVMYTSGSSGTPKGVAISHLAASQSLLAHEKHIPPFRRFLQFAAPSFDVSVFEIFFPLIRGATLVGCHRPLMLNDLTGVINRLDVDGAELTPTVAGSLVQQRANVPKLKLLLTIGEMLTRPVIDQFGRSETEDGILYGMYGPTEAAIHCTINPRIKAASSVRNIGVPFDTTSCFIVAIPESSEGISQDSSVLKILPRGEMGELVLGGPQLANGYLNRPDQNKAAFVTINGQRAYRTGDKARMMDDETIEIHGRISAGQVKLRGQRVELGEIEEAAYKHSNVKTVVVSVLHGSVVVFVLLKQSGTSSGDIIKSCSEWLPKFMIPSEVLVLEAFPYLPSGKIDKRQLESDCESRRLSAENDPEQYTVTEDLVGRVLEEIVGSRLTPSARFAAQGVDSLVAIRVASKLRLSGFPISTVDVLHSETLAKLARLCEKTQGTSSNTHSLDEQFLRDIFDATLDSLEKECDVGTVDSIFPCTPLQDAMLSETAIDKRAYNNTVELDLSNEIGEGSAREAFYTLSQHNKILQTGFLDSRNSKSVYVQVVWKSLVESQFSIVEKFTRDSTNIESFSLLRPFHVQVKRIDDHLRVLLHIHHALYDAWSLELLLNDLDVILRNGVLPSRPPFLRMVEAQLRSGELEDESLSNEYWKDHLSQLDARSMPNFHSVVNVAPGLCVMERTTKLSSRTLDLAARDIEVSPQSFFQTAYALILCSYLGTQDVCFGSVFSGRTAAIEGIEDIAGPCLSTLPIRVDLATISSPKSLVKQLASITRKHLQHDHVQLREIKKASGIDPGRPLFDSIIVWQQTLHDTQQRREHVALIESTDYLEFNLTLEITPGTENVKLKANYQRAIFPEQQIKILLHQIEKLVELLVTFQGSTLEQIYSALDEELVSILNPIPKVDRGKVTLASSVEAMAIEHPELQAINFSHSINAKSSKIERVTYRDLNAHANKFAHHLQSISVGPNELVCICMEKSVDLYTSILATVKAGAGYLPLTPDTPLERIKYILAAAEIRVIITQLSLKAVLGAELDVENVIYVEELETLPLSTENLLVESDSDDVAYSIFTSGSTGAPKGVLITQGNIMSNLEVLSELYPHSKSTRLLQSCSQAFDVSVFEIFFTWYVGGCLCSAVKDVLLRDIELAIREFRVTHLSLTPTVAALIDPDKVPNVEFLVTAGEAVTRKVFNSWAERGLYQGYGPSETTNICTVRPKVAKNDYINNIGPPLRNTSTFVLNLGSDFVPVPKGGEGEFCFGGAQVGRGYLDPNQAIGKFFNHPKYGWLYRSGDVGRVLPDGSLSFSRRVDDQVKIRGQRVELGEINNTLMKLQEVADCATLLIDDVNTNGQYLVTFWVPLGVKSATFNGLTPDPAMINTISSSLASVLPVYMIPAALLPVSKLPSTAQGKIDKRALITHYKSLSAEYLSQTSQRQEISSDHDWTDTEKKIAEAVAQITHVSPSEVKADISFFHLGIDSISAISLARILREGYDIIVEISDILKRASVIRLAKIVESNRNLAENTPWINGHDNFGFNKQFVDSITREFEIRNLVVKHVLPCTPLQEAMLSANEGTLENAYSNHTVLVLHVGPEEIEDAWSLMVQRHEILRTCFVRTDMVRFAYAQVVMDRFDKKLNVLELSGNDSTNAVEQLCSAGVEPFNHKPPYDLTIIKSDSSAKLLISMHHALYDGVALSILFEEIEQTLKKKALPPSVPFVPFLEHMVAANREYAHEFWDRLLEDFHPISLPQSYTPTESTTPEPSGKLVHARVKCDLSWIEDRVKDYNVSLLSVCQGVWSSLLAERLGSSDVCFGNVVSGRTLPVHNVDRLVAPCFNTLPVRIAELHKLTFLEAFRTLQTQNVDALPYQLTPLRRIQAQRETNGRRLFDTLLILQPPRTELDSNIWSIEDDVGDMDLPIVIEIVPNRSQNTLDLSLHLQSGYSTEQDALELLESFDSALVKSLGNARYQVLSDDAISKILSNPQDERNRRLSADKDDASGDSKNMSQLEIQIRDILADLTDTPKERIHLQTSIFRIGLDSISAVQVAAALRKQGHKVIASDILEHSSVQKLAAFLLQETSQSMEHPADFNFRAFDETYRQSLCARLKLDPQSIENIRPCTPVQCGMLAQSLHSDGQEYINSFCMRLLPGTSVEKLRSAWEAVMQQHEMLRSGFDQIEDPRYQFLILTYAAENYTIPWFEVEDRASANAPQQTIMQNLSRSPWRLEIFKDNGNVIVQFSAHHALYDAQSLELILSDVKQTYASSRPIQRPQINRLLGAILDAAEKNEEERRRYWQNDNALSINRFPDLTPLREKSGRSIVRERISALSILNFEELCKQKNVSMQALGQAAWARLLSMYIGEASVTFGVTLSGRSIIEDANVVSFPSIVTLPATCHVTESNGKLLERVMHLNAQMHKHQFTPLTQIQKWSGHRDKMFDTLFAYQKTAAMETSNAALWTVEAEQATADYAVSIEITPESDGRLCLCLTARESIIPAEQAELILQQYDALLEDTVRNSKNPCDIASSAGKEILSVTPPMEPELPGEVHLLHELVEVSAQSHSDKIALEFATAIDSAGVTSKKWTYQELNNASNGIANLLLMKGVKQGCLVAICFEKCPAASFAILGILKAGCAYVALDPNAPTDRLSFIMQDSQAGLVLTTGRPAEILSQASSFQDVAVIDVGHEGDSQNVNYHPPALSRAVAPQDTCYCLYTSGTTGTPKGCEITHDNAVQAMYSFSRLFDGHWTSSSKWLQFASFHFDVSVLEQFWTWSVAMCLVSAPRDLIFEDIPGAIRQLGITHIDLTPSLARLVHPDDVPSLWDGVFITGGEQLRQDILDVWGPKNCIYNGYGPTECTIGCTMYTRVPSNGKPANIGPAWLNAGSYVLKPGTNRPVLRGGVGELCITGRLVGKGYLNRPDLTHERFPYIEELGERVYRTGDLVRILHNGDFLFLGRADDQVKLRGQRLELGEINEVIKKNVDGLDHVVTLVLKHSEQQSDQLVTFFVAAKGNFENNLAGQMRHACQSRLPGYMVPTHFIKLPALPLSANNKVDSKQLAKHYNELSVEDLQSISSASRSIRQWSEAEKAVISALAKALSIEPVAVMDNSSIFELGVDSISVIGLCRALQESGYDNAKLSAVMENSSIESLTKLLTTDVAATTGSQVASVQNLAAFSHKHRVTVAEELGIDGDMIEAIAPCTPAQEGMIYRFLDSEEALYFNHFGFLLNAEVDDDLLWEAWSRVVSRLQILRTKFVLTVDGCVQVVLRELRQPFENVEINDDGDEEKAFETLQKHQTQSTLHDITKALGHPWNVAIGRYGSRRLLSLQMFHALYDGISLPMIFQKVQEEYQNKQNLDYGPPFQSVLPYGPLFSVAGAEDFWKKILAGAKYPTMPSTTTHTTSEDVTSTRVVKKAEGLETLRQRLGVTYQALLQAAWISVIQEYLTTDLTFGLVVSGRSIDFEGAERVIGPLLNTVVFHAHIAPDLTWKDLIQSCHAYNMAILPYQHTPLKEIQKWCGSGSSQSLFDTLFVFQREEIEDLDQQSLWRLLPTLPVADYPLAFEAELKRNANIQLTIVGQGSFINEILAAGILEKVEASLWAMLDPDDAVPMTDGKVDGKSKGSLESKSSPSVGTSDKIQDFSWTRDAEMIRTEISALTGASEFSQDASIFELGLDSIDVIKLSSRLKKAGIQLSVSAIIRNQTIAKMVPQIASKPEVDGQSHSVIETYEKEITQHLKQTGRWPEDALNALPVTPLQEGMVAEMITSGYTRYFNHDLFQICNDVDAGKLKEAWNTVIAKHEILRTTFVEVDDPELPLSYAQVIHRPGKSVWQSVHIKEKMPLEELSRAVIQSAIQEARNGQPLQLFDISHGQEKYFAISIAHALYDGWSLQALHDDIRNIYLGHSIQRPNPRAILGAVFKQDTPEAVKFWRTSLSGLPGSLLLQRDQGSDVISSTVHRREMKSRHALAEVQKLCKRTATTLQTLGQTVWSLLLAQYLRRLDVVFGVVLSCRDSEEANEVMFPLMNTVAVRSVLHGSLKEMLRYMQDNANATKQFQHFPLRKAQILAGMNNGEGGLFNTLFIYQGQRKKEDNQKLYESVESVSEVEFAVCVELEVLDDVLVWRTACKDGIRNTAQTEELLESLDRLLWCFIHETDAQTITTDGDYLSICGMEKFTDQSVATTTNSLAKTHAPNSYKSTWTELELRIRRVVSQITKISESDINKDQTIFHLGLDSISAIKLSSILRRDGIKLGISDMMANNTIASMAAFLGTRSESRREISLNVGEVLSTAMRDVNIHALLEHLKLKQDDVETVMPATAGQLYMLARWQASGGTTFTAKFEYALRSIDERRLDQAWRFLQERHALLRTRFAMTGQENLPAVQVVARKPQNVIEWVDGSFSKSSQVSLSSPISLGVERRGETTILCIHTHHALYDAVSLPLIIDDMVALYNNPESVVPTSDFREFVARNIGTPGQHKERHEFWRSYLDKSSLLPTSTLASSQNSNQRIEVFRPSIRIGDIAKVARSDGVTVDALLLAIFSKVYSKFLTQSNDITLGLYLSNRSTHRDYSDLRAPTLNLLPIRIPISSTSTQIAAQKVQQDLHALGTSSISGSSLLDIWRWTGVRVDCFVNILKTASHEDDTSANGEKNPGKKDDLFDALDQQSAMRCERAEIRNVVPARAREGAVRLDLEAAYLVSFLSSPPPISSGVLRCVEYIQLISSCVCPYSPQLI